MLEQFLKANGLNRTKIGYLLDVSPPSTRLLLDKPMDMKISQMVSLCNETNVSFQDLSGLIFGSHYVVMENDKVKIMTK